MSCIGTISFNGQNSIPKRFHRLYVAAGGSDDYAMSIGIPFAFTLELGKEKDNFAAPVQSLPDILESGWEVIIAMIKKASEFVEQ